MIDLGPHAFYIVAAYAGVALVITGLVTMILIKAQRQKNRLSALEALVPRRSDRDSKQ